MASVDPYTGAFDRLAVWAGRDMSRHVFAEISPSGAHELCVFLGAVPISAGCAHPDHCEQRGTAWDVAARVAIAMLREQGHDL